MEGKKFTKLALVISIMLITMNIGIRVFSGFSSVEATTKVHYRVVSAKPIKTCAEYEELLNRMAGHGWVFDHFIEAADIAVFRK
jgi:hypothetical protein